MIESAVSTIRYRYFEPLTLDDLAQSARVSKFHFLRTFRRVTGVTPGRFLTAVRLEEAKRLLLTTSLNVSDVSAQVGYSSTGSFTRRFTESVGCSPTQYRQYGPGESVGGPALGPAAVTGGRDGRGGTVTGVVRVFDPGVTAVYIGVFESSILERCPAVRAVIIEPGSFRLTGVPEGTWFIHAVGHGTHPDGVPSPGKQNLLVGTVGPIDIAPGEVVDLNLTVRPPAWHHPPILLALPDLVEQSPIAA
ncbi:helix-turn-helix transcriptional regulator [Kitasatospora sp. NPDC098652]|uniref:helix-turn-helix transcriptional regulator n=1 Tax=Kitasatospora sp. NPDC098652 TaxID=3364095 RepID=UPI0038225108